jgi:hypothetical protein
MWEVRMLEDKDFADLIHNRYFELRKTILSLTQLESVIDSAANLLNEAQARHFQKWNILGINVGTPEPGFQPTSYAGEIDKFKNWIRTRLAWLDANMISSVTSVEKVPADQVRCRVFPNPATDNLFVESIKEIKGVSLYNLSGSQVFEKKDICDFSVSMNMTGLNQGVYVVKIYFSSGKTEVTRVVKR